MKSAVRLVLSLFIVIGIGLALWPMGQWAYARWNQQQLHKQWAAERQLPRTTAAKPRTLASGKPSAKNKKPQARPWPSTRIVSSDMDLNAVVLSGFDEATLRRGPGHLPSSALPGETGNCVIAAHRNVYGSYFYNVDKLFPGAEISLQTSDADYKYTVFAIQTIADNDISVLRPPAEPNEAQLTLITCQTQRTTTRIVVMAQLASSTESY